jgi:HEAT repeat protein
MILILGELQDRRQRRLLCEILAELGRQDVEVLADALTDERWYLLRNLAMILGMTRQAGAVKHIEKILTHPDVRVRREAVRALDVIRTDDTKMPFFSLLGDADQTIRMTALKALRRFRDTTLFQTLKGTVTAEELKKKSFAEKRELLETLAALGGKDAFPLLSELFRKKGFIEKEEATEIRAAAAYGLGIIGSPEAASLLEKEAGTRKEILREACAEALKEMKRDGDIRK